MADFILRAATIKAIVGLTAFKSEDELKKFVEEKVCDDYYLGGLCDVIDKINDATAVDAVPVVRCRDCKFYYGVNEECGCNSGYHSEDWYCADGERRDSE